MSAAVRVQETRVFATRRASDWWIDFCRAHKDDGRIQVVTATLGGAVCLVACADHDHALWLAEHMEAQGIPSAALTVVHGKEIAA